MLVHDKFLLLFDYAESAFYPRAGFFQVFFRHPDIQFCRNIFQLLVDFFNFHDPIPDILRAACVHDEFNLFFFDSGVKLLIFLVK